MLSKEISSKSSMSCDSLDTVHDEESTVACSCSYSPSERLCRSCTKYVPDVTHGSYDEYDVNIDYKIHITPILDKEKGDYYDEALIYSRIIIYKLVEISKLGVTKYVKKAEYLIPYDGVTFMDIKDGKDITFEGQPLSHFLRQYGNSIVITDT